jgi:hypothetical protein
MYKAIKDVRRRAVESLLETVGASEVTVDKDFDELSIKFETVIQELNQCTYNLACLQYRFLFLILYVSR